MKAHAKSKNAKARSGFIRGKWLERVHPTFLNYWTSIKNNRALAKIEDEKEAQQEFRKWLRNHGAVSRALDEAKKQIKNPLAPKILAAMMNFEELSVPSYSNSDPRDYPQNPESSGTFRKLVFLKYGITYRELMGEIDPMRQIDIEKDAPAYRKLAAVHIDYWRLMSGLQFKDLKLKFNSDHFDLITQGFDFGLKRLTPDELADCLDEICPCSFRHSSEYLKKLRLRIKKLAEATVGPNSDVVTY